MSYDITFYKLNHTANDERVDPDLNITSNLFGMLSWAFDVDDWEIEVQGVDTALVAERIANAVKKLVLHKEEAEAYNTSNGWGTRKQLIPWLIEFCEACQEYPHHTVNIS